MLLEEKTTRQLIQVLALCSMVVVWLFVYYAFQSHHPQKMWFLGVAVFQDLFGAGVLAYMRFANREGE